LLHLRFLTKPPGIAPSTLTCHSGLECRSIYRLSGWQTAATIGRTCVVVFSRAKALMTATTLPLPLPSPRSVWVFQRAWPAADQAASEQTLRERIPNSARARNDSWVFLAHAATYYAHSPSIHSAGVGFAAATAADLAEVLWDHYFSLHLGPLAWS